MTQPNQADLMSDNPSNTDSASDLTTTPDIKAIIIDLYINRMKPKQVADKYGYSERTIYRKMQSEEAMSIRKRVALPLQEDRLALDLVDKTHEAVQYITKSKMSKAKLTDIMQFVFKAVETIRLLTDRSTSNVTIAHYLEAGTNLMDLLQQRK